MPHIGKCVATVAYTLTNKGVHMTNSVNKAGGPKTPQGKAISSQNAVKAGIFSKGYLPWEDREAKD